MRENIPIKYKWKIEDIFPNQKAFDNLYEETKNEIEFSSFKDFSLFYLSSITSAACDMQEVYYEEEK